MLCVLDAGPPPLPLQIACLAVVEVPLPAAGLYLVCVPADGLSACQRTQLGPCLTSCRPSALAAASCLPCSSRGALARCRSLVGALADSLSACQRSRLALRSTNFLYTWYASLRFIDCFQPGPAFVQLEAAPLRSVALLLFLSKQDSSSFNGAKVSFTQAVPLLPPWGPSSLPSVIRWGWDGAVVGIVCTRWVYGMCRHVER